MKPGFRKSAVKLTIGLGVVAALVGGWGFDCAGRTGRWACSESLGRSAALEEELRQAYEKESRFDEQYRAAILLCGLSKAAECPAGARHGADDFGERPSWTRAYPRFEEVVGRGRREWCRFISAAEADAECKRFVREQLEKTEKEFAEIQEWNSGRGVRNVALRSELADVEVRAFECLSAFAPFSTGSR